MAPHVEPLSTDPLAGLDMSRPAAQPSRRANAEVEGSPITLPDTPTRGLDQPFGGADAPLQSSSPPADPGLAAELSEYKERLGKAIERLGQIERDQADERARMSIQLEIMASAQQRPAAQPPSSLPDNVDPNAPLTLGQWNQIANVLIPGIQADAQARAVRAVWDITSEEEQGILQANPALLQIEEPRRTHLIKKAADITRRARNESAPASTPAPQALATPQTRPTRAAAPTVPLVEHTFAPNVPDHEPQDEVGAAAADYAAASQIKDRKERLAAMRRAADRYNRAVGISDEDLKNSQFRQKR